MQLILVEENATCMADAYITYLNVCSSNSLDSTVSRVPSRKELNRVLCEKMTGIVFMKRINESELISMSPVIDAEMWKLEQEGNEYHLKSLLEAALVI